MIDAAFLEIFLWIENALTIDQSNQKLDEDRSLIMMIEHLDID